MDRPGESRDVAGFLKSLVEELAVTPDEVTASRHVSAAAATARALVGGPRRLRWIAAAAAMVTVLGTGGVAMAGALPDPIQTAVADVARVLPLPVSVPYPDTGLIDPVPVDHPEVDTWTQERPAEAIADEPGESVEAPDLNAASSTSSEHSPVVVGDRSDHLSCDSDGGQSNEGRARHSACDEFVAPPRFDQGEDGIDRDHEENRDEEFGDRDRESREDMSSDVREGDSEHRGHDESDRQEERHDHESPDDDSSIGRN